MCLDRGDSGSSGLPAALDRLAVKPSIEALWMHPENYNVINVGSTQQRQKLPAGQPPLPARGLQMDQSLLEQEEECLLPVEALYAWHRHPQQLPVLVWRELEAQERRFQ